MHSLAERHLESARYVLDSFVHSARLSLCASGIDPAGNRRENLRRPLLLQPAHVSNIRRLELLGQCRQHTPPVDSATQAAEALTARGARASDSMSEACFLLLELAQFRLFRADILA